MLLFPDFHSGFIQSDQRSYIFNINFRNCGFECVCLFNSDSEIFLKVVFFYKFQTIYMFDFTLLMNSSSLTATIKSIS